MARAWVWVLAGGCGSLSFYGKPDEVPVDPTAEPTTTDGVALDTGDPGTEPPPTTTTTTPPSSDTGTTTEPSGGSYGGTTPTEPACVYPSTPVVASGPPAFGMFNPWFVGVGFYGVTSSGAVYDYDAGGTSYSAVVSFTFYDYYGFPVCDIVYDASVATPAVDAWTTDSGLALFERFDLALAGGDSSCGVAYGYDLRDVVEAFDWGIGFGPLAGLTGFLQYLVASSGQDWTTEWAPYAFAVYVEGGLAAPAGTAVEAGWATALDRDCGEVFVDASGVGTPIAMPTAGPLDHYVNGHPLLIFPWPAL
ncbi:MAG: hypothetical protein ABMA64_23005 [Myxococcota bacterium]